MNYRFLYIIVALCVFSTACSQQKSPNGDEARNFQLISTLGDSLFASGSNAHISAIETDSFQTVDDIIARAQELETGNRYQQALAIYQQAAEPVPCSALIRKNMGNTQLALRQFNDAQHSFRLAAGRASSSASKALLSGIQARQGVLQFLRGDAEAAADTLSTALRHATTASDSMAITYWRYLSLRRAGLDMQAGTVLEPVAETQTLEGHARRYHQLLMVFKGNFEEQSLLDDTETPQESVLIGYGLANWHYINGRRDRAQELLRATYDHRNQWPADSFIGAEIDLQRLFNAN